MIFLGADHESEFKKLKELKHQANTTLDYADYCYAYYILTADPELRKLFMRFMNETNGDIKWEVILKSKIIHENYRQVVALAHQLYSGGWKNKDFNFMKLLNDLQGKPQLLDAVFEGCRLYTRKAFLPR